jgi:hypothetical protein
MLAQRRALQRHTRRVGDQIVWDNVCCSNTAFNPATVPKGWHRIWRSGLDTSGLPSQLI